jgi:hypothetical protein
VLPIQANLPTTKKTKKIRRYWGSEKAAAAMKSIYKKNKMGVDVYISNVNTKGAQQIK